MRASVSRLLGRVASRSASLMNSKTSIKSVIPHAPPPALPGCTKPHGGATGSHFVLFVGGGPPLLAQPPPPPSSRGAPPPPPLENGSVFGRPAPAPPP